MRHRLPEILLIGLGAALLATSLLSDVVRHQPFSFGSHQSLAAVAGALLMAEGALRLRGRDGLWGVVASDAPAATVLTYAIALALIGALLYLFRSYAVDDSYITFRYARNLAEGRGVVWNPGEPPVEGYSNFLWMLMLAAAQKLGLDPLATARTIAIACQLLTLPALRRLALRHAGGTPYANLAVLVFAAVPAFSYWTMSGLETASVVLFAVLYFLALGDEAGAALPWRSALCADLLILSRPDAPLLILVPLLPLLVPPTAARLRWVGRLALLALPVAAGYLGWKALTFHRLFANTVAAKLRIGAGLPVVTDFVLLAFPLLALLLVRTRSTARVFSLQLLLTAAAYTLALLNAASQVGHYYRFYLPLLAPMLAAIPLCFGAAEPGPRTGAPWRPALLGLILLYALTPVIRMLPNAAAEAAGLERAHVAVGRLLRDRYGERGLLAASDCGIIPYLSRMRTIDIWGLTDRRIAERGFDPKYVLAARPDVIILNSVRPDSLVGRESYDRELGGRVGADKDYGLLGRWEFVGYWLWVYARAPAAGLSTGPGAGRREDGGGGRIRTSEGFADRFTVCSL